ncbi:MAG: (2Fe-2S) ferredoxin domain-containing protein [Bacteroidales bacterium]|jgi:NADH:ubiquinone oxidoreductase subunit E
MVNIKVCVGSSCHLKGSYQVIEALKSIIKKYDVEDLIDLQASFCLGFCSQGVSVSADGFNEKFAEKLEDGCIYLHNVNSENAEELFVNNIYPLLEL